MLHTLEAILTHTKGYDMRYWLWKLLNWRKRKRLVAKRLQAIKEGE